MSAQYDEVVPGAAEQILRSHLRREAVGADAVERLSTAEALAAAVGAIGAQVLAMVGLVAAILLVVNGFPAWAVSVGVPAVLGGAAQVVTAVRRGSAQRASPSE